MFIFNANQLNVNAVLEVMMAANFGRFRLPSRSEFFLEDHKMRIAHGYRSAFDLTKSQLDRKRFADLRLAHVGLKAEALAFACVQHAAFDAGAGAHQNLFPAMLAHPMGGHAAGSIAGDFRLRAIGVEQAGANIRLIWRIGKQPLHPIGAYSRPPIADAARKCR